MTDLPLALALFLLVNLVVALLRVLRGPTPADRMLVAVLFGTTGVAILILLAEAQDVAALVDVALVFALLAAIAGAAVSVRAWRRSSGQQAMEEGARDPD